MVRISLPHHSDSARRSRDSRFAAVVAMAIGNELGPPVTGPGARHLPLGATVCLRGQVVAGPHDLWRLRPALAGAAEASCACFGFRISAGRGCGVAHALRFGPWDGGEIADGGSKQVVRAFDRFH